MLRRAFIFLLSLCVVFLSLRSSLAEDDTLPSDLTQVGIEKLLSFDLVVTSPGKKEQEVSKVSSAIYVLTTDDIRRSGVTHIAEALRLIPGVNVARVSASQWAVSIRGFNQVYAHKLLVLIDGVSAFSPLTNGVYWETLDVLMQDIERIEVIRGPGAALWGANAENGVVNIITKRAQETRGGLVTAAGGVNEKFIGSARYGSKIGEKSSARLSAKYSDESENRLVGGGGADDFWQISSFDGRIDTELDETSNLTFVGHGFNEGDHVQTSTPILQPPFVDNVTYSGRGKWKGGYGAVNYRNKFSSKSILNVTGSVVRQIRESSLIDVDYNVYELDATHQISPWDDHELVYGGSYRLFENSADGTYAQSFSPENRSMYRGNWFLQDEIALAGDNLHLILGSKFEHNSSTGFEHMPNARVIWSPDEKNSVWGAVSRAVAAPALVFEDVRFPVAAIPASEQLPDTLVEVFGDREVDSEYLVAYEMGYRSELNERVSVDISGFYNRYDNVFSQEPEEPFIDPLRANPTLVVPLRFRNAANATSVGGEASLEWKPLDRSKFNLGYAYLSVSPHTDTSKEEELGTFIRGSAPRHTVLLRASADVSDSVTCGVLGRFVDSLELGDVPSYFEVDANLLWQITDAWSLAVVGQNLLDNSHKEYVGNLFGPPPTEIRRAAFGIVEYKF